MGFRLVPKSVTLNDLEGRNGLVLCIISPNSIVFGTYYVKVVADTRIHLRVKCSPKNLVFNDISREMSQSTPTKHDGRAVLFAVAELLVRVRHNH